MSGFADVCARWTETARARLRAIPSATLQACRDSWVDGSSRTGSLGLPERTGAIREDVTVRAETGHGTVTTMHPAARVIESGIERGSPIRYAHGGGPHALTLTKAGFTALVADVVEKVRADT